MRIHHWLLLLAATTTGCSSLTPTENGVLGGAAVGGLGGAAIGKALGNTGAGAAVGAVAGGVTGGLIGNDVENREKQAIQQAQAVQAARQLGLTDVVQMSQGHVSDAVIIGQIRSSGSVFRLSPTDLQWLKDNGVIDAVVVERQQNASRGPYVYRRPQPGVVVCDEPVYDALPRIGIGVVYGHSR